MKLSNLFLVSAIIYILFGLGTLIVPAQVGSLYGLTLTAGQNVPVQDAGAALIGLALLCWLVRKQASNPTLHSIILALFVYNVIGTVVFLLAEIRGHLSMFGWVSVVLYALLAIGYGYFHFT